jgi:ketopantoate reductase
LSAPVAVFGAGHSGFGLAGDLALRGFAVRLCEHPDFVAALDPVRSAGGIAVRGVTGEGHAPLAMATTDADAALEGVALAFVVVPAYAHAAMARMMAPHLRTGQTVVLMPGNAGGAFAFRHALLAAGAPRCPSPRPPRSSSHARRTGRPASGSAGSSAASPWACCPPRRRTP